MTRIFTKSLSLFLLLCLLVCTTACGGNPADGSSGNASGNASGSAGNHQNSDGVANKPFLVQTEFETLDSVVAVKNAVDFGADPTGQKDSSTAINNALVEASLCGGGTVWLPKGQYLVTRTVKVPAHCTLRGDWNDPDGKSFNGDYGTVILAKPAPSERKEMGLIQLSESGGARGLTVYYPEQDINNVQKYAPTFAMFGSVALRTLRDITLINSYIGVYAQQINESVNLINFKGTCLSHGIELESVGDVGEFDTVSFAPEYWANAKGEGIKAASRAAIVKYCKDNKSKGFYMHDLEQQRFLNVKVSGHCYGIFFSAEPTRFMSSGPMYQLNIKDCTYGIYAAEGTFKSTNGYAADQCPILTSLDWRCGYVISNSVIEGDKYSIYNGSSTVEINSKKRQGYFRLCDVQLKGASKGSVFYTNSKNTVDLPDVQNFRKTKTTGTAFEYLLEGAKETDIQAALDRIGNAGGGVLYLGGGDYEIANGLTVPKNTEIVGACGGSPQRLPNNGTVLWCRQKGTAAAQTDAKALVTLNGDNSGVRGIYFMYDENILAIDKQEDIKQYPFALRGKGKGVWAVNCCLAGPSHGIDFKGCDNHLVEELFSACVYSQVELGGKNGMIRNTLANGTVMFRTNNVLDTDINNLFKGFFDTYGRPSSYYISVYEGEGQQCYNNFTFGCRHLLYIDGMKNLVGVNSATDAIGKEAVYLKSGSARISNAITTTVNTWYNEGGSLEVYNPNQNLDEMGDYVSNK